MQIEVSGLFLSSWNDNSHILKTVYIADLHVLKASLTQRKRIITLGCQEVTLLFKNIWLC